VVIFHLFLKRNAYPVIEKMMKEKGCCCGSIAGSRAEDGRDVFKARSGLAGTARGKI